MIKFLLLSLPWVSQNMLEQALDSRKDIELVGVANGGLSGINLINKHSPHVVVIDSNLPRTETVELLRILKEERPNTYSVMLVDTSEQIPRAMKATPDLIVRSYEFPDKLDAIMEYVREKQKELTPPSITKKTKVLHPSKINLTAFDQR